MECPFPLLDRLLGPGRFFTLAVLLVVTAALGLPASRVEVERDNRSMIAGDRHQTVAHERLRTLFGNDEQLLLSVSHPQLLGPEGLQLLREITTRVENLAGVVRAWSLANATQLVSGPWGAEQRPLLEKDAGIGQIVAILEGNPHFDGLLASLDRRTAGIVIEPAGQVDRRPLVAALRNLKREYAGRADLHLSGVAVQKSDIAEYVVHDQRSLLPLVVAVLALMLAVIFRHPSGVLLPLATTGISLVWTMGCYALAGLQLNTITSLLPPVIMVLSVSTSVHLYNGWLHLQGDDAQRLALLSAKVRELFTPCLFTSLTTALGLLSLTVSQVPAVRQFGLFAALGVFFSFLVSISLVPTWLSFQRLVINPQRREGLGLLSRVLSALVELTLRRPAAVMLVALILTALSVSGVPKIRNNTDLIAFLKDDAPLAVDTRHIDRQLGGVNSFEFIFERNDGKPLLGLADYRKLEELAVRFADEPLVEGLLSPLNLLLPLHRAESGGGELVLPANQDEMTLLLDLLALAPDQQLAEKFLTKGRDAARLSVRLPIVGSQQAVELLQRLQGGAHEILGSDYRITATGSFHQLVVDSTHLVADMLRSFSLSLGLVMLSILVLLRSLRLTLLALIPNLIPMLWALGVMGYAGIDLSTGTAMIGAVVIGLAVDDTIHYLVHYRRVFRGDASRAVLLTTTGSGRALTISSLVLALGFWVGCFGSFWPTIYFSLLVGGTLIAALICDLLVLPAVLVLSCPRRRALSS